MNHLTAPASAAHNRLADIVATQIYLPALAAHTAEKGRFHSLASLLADRPTRSFLLEKWDHVRTLTGSHRLNLRWNELEVRAKFVIKQELDRNPVLRDKLVAVRAAEAAADKDRDHAEFIAAGNRAAEAGVLDFA